MVQTAMIGVGVMGEAVLAGLVRGGEPADQLLAVCRRRERADELAGAYAVPTSLDVTDAADARTVILGVKPYDVAGVLTGLAPHLRAGQLVVSLAAGVTTAAMEALLPEGVGVVRVMPNTPSLVGEGMSVISGGAGCTDEQLAETERLMRAVGKVVVLPEKQQDAATAVAGSGPAYVFYVVEAMVEAGVHLGLPRAVATELAVQTVAGSGELLRRTGTHPTLLREQVTSPGGTTAAALRQLDEHGVRAAFLAALEANRDRSRAMGS